jgi:tetratricopeptide (TPR) repeat protein
MRLESTLSIVISLTGIIAWFVSSCDVPNADRSVPVPVPASDSPAPRPLAPGAFHFTDVTDAAGIRFQHEAGARGEMLQPETFGPGAGWVDVDGDGRIDLLCVNGNALRGDVDASITSILYRNSGGGRFEDVTRESGLDRAFYGMGFVAGDIDDDGDQDLFVYGLHRAFLYRNDGRGRFDDVTQAAGFDRLSGWIMGAAFLDADRDGILDLFVGNYVEWHADIENGLDCTFGTGEKKYCPVAYFQPTAPQFFRGIDGLRFEERTEAAGLSKLRGRVLGVIVEDIDADGDADILCANDAVQNFLLRNRGDGTFDDIGLESGFATDGSGVALAGMGIDAAWLSESGPLIVAIGNFSGEPTTVHVQEGPDFFAERSFRLGVAAPTLRSVTFGLLLRDLDLDGIVDLAMANGHVFDIEAIQRVPYRQPAQVFRGIDGGTFALIAPPSSADVLATPYLGRGLACADYDGDGDLDLVLTENQGRLHLLRNELAAPRCVRIGLRGTRSIRDAFGAVVVLKTHRSVGGAERIASYRQTKRSSSSYLGPSEPTLTFGLDADESPVSVEVAWPSGTREKFDPPSSKITIEIVEGSGVSVEHLEAMAVRAPGSGDSARATTSSSVTPNPAVLRREGRELLEARRDADAVRIFERAIGIDPHDIESQRSLLIALARLGRRDALAARIDEICELFPSANVLISRFGEVLASLGARSVAEAFYIRASQLDPERVDVWTTLGNFAFDRGEMPLAVERYERALGLDPGAFLPLVNAGKAFAIAKDRAKAMDYLERALRVDPESPSALSTLGGLLGEAGRLDDAEEMLVRALSLTEPSDRENRLTIHGNLGIVLLRRGESQRALEEFQKVLELDPNDEGARKAVARLRR